MADHPREADRVPLPEPFTVASTIKCVGCGAPYEPMRNPAPNAAPTAFPWQPPSNACKCGSTAWEGTMGYDSPSPAVYTADQLRAYATACVAAAVAEDRAEIQKLQKALFFWLPNVPAMDGAVGDRIADDAWLLAGYEGDSVQSAEQLGWIKLTKE